LIYSGHTAIEYLAAEANKDDIGASSHWKRYHSDFRFLGDGFAGLEGFGGCERPHRGLRSVAHTLLARRFYRMGVELPQFTTIDGMSRGITSRQGRSCNLDVLRQSLTLAFLKKHLPEQVLSSHATVCVIGDGFASMTSLLLASHSAGLVVLVNLTKTLLVDLWYLKLWMGDEKYGTSVDLVTDPGGLFCAIEKASNKTPPRSHVVAIQASDHELLQDCPVDVALNIVSMQEMTPAVIAEYFNDLRSAASRKKLFFYCCNRQEKKLPDGTITRFMEYPWKAGDQILVDELCPWHQQYYSLRPPFYRPYDGPIQHRLVTFI